MRFRQLNHLIGLAALAAALAGTSAAHALTFDLTYDSSLSAFGANEAALEAATQDVANEYSKLYTNNVTVNVDVKVDPSNGLGASQFENDDTGTISYAQLKAALESHASTPASESAVAGLPAADPTDGAGFYLTNAEAKALGSPAATTPRSTGRS